jgi:insulysin
MTTPTYTKIPVTGQLDADTTWSVIPRTPLHPGFKVFQGDIEKPDLDQQEYRIIRLDNGLLAVLIHDRDADKSAASLTVHVGYQYDPVRDVIV